MSSNPWSLARRRGWLEPTNSEQSLAWRDYCFKNNLDCIVVTRSRNAYELSCDVNPDHPFSELAYKELEEFLESNSCDSWSMGRGAGSASRFSFEVSNLESMSDVIAAVREILRRDRTPRRRVEITGNNTLQEGFALSDDSVKLWDDHKPNDRVYVMEMEGRPGQCVVFKHLKPPLVDLPLSSFTILASHDA